MNTFVTQAAEVLAGLNRELLDDFGVLEIKPGEPYTGRATIRLMINVHTSGVELARTVRNGLERWGIRNEINVDFDHGSVGFRMPYRGDSAGWGVDHALEDPFWKVGHVVHAVEVDIPDIHKIINAILEMIQNQHRDLTTSGQLLQLFTPVLVTEA